MGAGEPAMPLGSWLTLRGISVKVGTQAGRQWALDRSSTTSQFWAAQPVAVPARPSSHTTNRFSHPALPFPFLPAFLPIICRTAASGVAILMASNLSAVEPRRGSL